LGFGELKNLGHVEWCDLREITKRFHVLGDLKGLMNVNVSKQDADIWESRSLIKI